MADTKFVTSSTRTIINKTAATWTVASLRNIHDLSYILAIFIDVFDLDVICLENLIHDVSGARLSLGRLLWSLNILAWNEFCGIEAQNFVSELTSQRF